MDLKYVHHDSVGFIIWPRSDKLWHVRVASVLARGGIKSAGFASVDGGLVRCWGRSESLGIGSDPDDSRDLAEQLGLKPVGG